MSPERDLEAQVPPAQEPAGGAGDPWKGREPVWDNLKGICVLLVVLIHTLKAFEQEVVAEGHFASGLILPLLFVVMPAFCFSAGYLSKVADTRQRAVSLFRMWAVFVLAQLTYAVFWAQWSQNWQPSGSTPFPFWEQPLPGVTWFLLCLAVWKTALPLLDLLRWPVATTLVLSMLSQLTDTGRSNFVQPLLCFLPFFMAGYSHPKGVLERQQLPMARCAFLSILVASPAVSLVLPSLPGGEGLFDTASRLVWTSYGCLYGGPVGRSLAMDGMTCHGEAGPVGNLVFFLLAAPLVRGFLAAVPRRRVWAVSRAGALSVYIFLFHIYFLIVGKAELMRALDRLHQRDAFQSFLHGPYGVFACILLAVALWGFLASGVLRPLCHPCVEPKVEVLLADVTEDQKAEKQSFR